MRLLPRKMTFQLTPLLDLLLIVIFAQFMEVQQTSTESEAALETRAAQMQQDLDAELRARREELERELAARRQTLEQERRYFSDAFRSVLEQQDKAGKLLAELFEVPEEAVNTLLKVDPRNEPYTQQQANELRSTLRTLQQSKGRELLKMLISYGEMKKRCDLWEVYVSDDDTIEFDNGVDVVRFRATTREEIEDGLFKAYKTSPEPRTLVILLFSFGDASAGARQRAQDALPGAIARMRADTGPRKWFEFAVLGFAPEGPSLRAGNR